METIRARSLPRGALGRRDRKSTRLNSSHSQISYAVFCLKKKKRDQQHKNHFQSLCHSLLRPPMIRERTTSTSPRIHLATTTSLLPPMSPTSNAPHSTCYS